MGFPRLVVSGNFHAFPHQYHAYMTTFCRSRCLSERVRMYIYWFPTNKNGIMSARLVAIFSLYPLDRKPQWRLIFDDTGGASGNRTFSYIPLYVAESACKGPKWL